MRFEMEKPFVVCHMLASLDGKIDGDFFAEPKAAAAVGEYARLRGFYGCEATVYGTTTMLGGYAEGMAPSLPETEEAIPREDLVSVCRAGAVKWSAFASQAFGELWYPPVNGGQRRYDQLVFSSGGAD